MAGCGEVGEGGQPAMASPDADPYSLLQLKLNDLTQRFAHEGRYVQECAPVPAGAGGPGAAGVFDPPYKETFESLDARAVHSAHAIAALNLQLQQLLDALPPDDVGEQEQMVQLQELIAQNRDAGLSVREEKHKVAAVLAQVRDVMGHLPHRSPTDGSLEGMDSASGMCVLTCAPCVRCIRLLWSPAPVSVRRQRHLRRHVPAHVCPACISLARARVRDPFLFAARPRPLLPSPIPTTASATSPDRLLSNTTFPCRVSPRSVVLCGIG